MISAYWLIKYSLILSQVSVQQGFLVAMALSMEHERKGYLGVSFYIFYSKTRPRSQSFLVPLEFPFTPGAFHLHRELLQKYLVRHSETPRLYQICNCVYSK